MTEFKKRDYVEIFGWVLIAVICIALVCVLVMPVHGQFIEGSFNVDNEEFSSSPGTTGSGGGFIAALDNQSWIMGDAVRLNATFLREIWYTEGTGATGFLNNTNAPQSFGGGITFYPGWDTGFANPAASGTWAVSLDMAGGYATFRVMIPLGFSSIPNTTSFNVTVTGATYQFRHTDAGARTTAGQYFVPVRWPDSLYGWGKTNGASAFLRYNYYGGKFQVDYNLTTNLQPSQVTLTPRNGTTYRYVIHQPTGAPLSSSSFTGDPFWGGYNYPYLTINVYDQMGRNFTASGLYTPNYTVMNPPQANVYQTFQSTLFSSGGLASVQSVTWAYNDEQGRHIFFDPANQFLRLAFSLRAGTWYQWNETAADYTVSKGATLPNPVSMQIGSSGTKYITATVIQTDGYLALAKNPINITSGGDYIDVTIMPMDWNTGALIQGCSYAIKNQNTNTWFNSSTSGNMITLSMPKNAQLYAEVYPPLQTVYLKSTATKSLGDQDTNWFIMMYPTSGYAAGSGNVTLFVTVRDYPGDTVQADTMVHLQTGQSKITGTTGTVYFPGLVNNTWAQIQAIKTGYLTGTKTVLLYANLSTQAEVVYISKAPITPIPTTTTLGAGVTAIVTEDTRSSLEKQSAGAKIIFDNIEGLISLLVIGTFIGILKMMGKI